MSSTRRALALLGASLALRGALWAVVAGAGVEPVFDEVDYAAQAEALASLWTALASLSLPDPEVLREAAAMGRWPPLHGVVLSVGALVGGVGAMRAVVALLSALTTPLVYLAARRLGVGERGAVAAAVVHLVYPTFIAFSHLLWAETLLAALVPALLLAGTAAAESGGRRATLVTGLLLGLAALAKTAALPWVLVVPVWIGLRRRRWQPAAWCLGAALVVVAPWQVALVAGTGQPVLLGTSSAVNLAHGNHAGIRDGMGSSHGDAEGSAALEAAIAEVRAGTDLSRSDAARRVAVDEFSARPGAAIARSGHRLAEAWAPDWLPVRHLRMGAYGEVPGGLVFGFWMLSWGAWLVLLTTGVAGVIRAPRRHGLPLVLVLAAMAGPALTLAMSRVHLPWLVALLPAAGAVLSSRPDGRTWVGLALGLALAVLVAALTVPGILTVHLGG